MSASLKLISLNIERSKHLDVVLPFLKEQQADVVCLQEVMERDLSTLADAAGTLAQFVPMTLHSQEMPPGMMGVGIFSRLPVRASDVRYYGGDPAHLPELDQRDMTTWNNKNFPLASCEIIKNDTVFKVATTHFRWTPDGEPDDDQRQGIVRLLGLLATTGEFVLTGDFNAPRGGEIFSMLAGKYTDNVPPKYVTSLDIQLHRAGKTKPHELATKMVDGIFSTPTYVISDVELISGVSDHCAIVAAVSKNA